MKRLTALTGALLLVCASPLMASDAGMASTGLRAVVSLLAIVALMFGLAWVIKTYGPLARVKRSLGLDIIAQVAVGAKASIALIRVGGSVLLIGVTAQAVNLLKDMEQGDFEKSLNQVMEHPGEKP